MSKTAEEILEKYCPSMSNIYLDDNGIKFRARVVKSMEEYASQQLAEKDKVIERLKRRKLVHQLFIGKVADILSVEKVQDLLRESNESINKMI